MKTKEMMGEHSSYHQNIQGDEAERRLKQFNAHCYLTRFSNHHGCYMLSVFKQQRPTDVMRHFKIIIKDDRKHLIEGKDEEFDDIGQLLAHYENHRIDPALKNIGTNYKEELHLQAENGEMPGGEMVPGGEGGAGGERVVAEGPAPEQRPRQKCLIL